MFVFYFYSVVYLIYICFISSDANDFNLSPILADARLLYVYWLYFSINNLMLHIKYKSIFYMYINLMFN